MRRTQNKIPGSVPLITNIAGRNVDLHPIPTRVTTTRRSPRTHTPSAQLVPTRIPSVRFSPIPNGLRSRPIISQEAIIFLTKCMWAQSSDIFTPEKLHPATSQSCINFKQLATPMVYPTTGETISSYKNSCMTPPPQRHGRQPLVKTLGAWPRGTIKPAKKGLIQFLLCQMTK